MTHEEIERREIAEEYVRGRLPAEERVAFEDHYFGCEECFAKVRELEQFAGGVRAAVEAGEIPLRAARGGWYESAFYVAAAAAVAMGVGLGWTMLRERPRLEAEVALARESGRRQAAELERKLMTSGAVANLPMLMLEASRGEEGAKLVVPAGTAQVALWMEPPPGAAGAVYRLEIRDPADRVVQVVEGAKTNAYGALAMAVPAEGLQAGRYAARLYRVGGTLVADYRFVVVR